MTSRFNNPIFAQVIAKQNANQVKRTNQRLNTELQAQAQAQAKKHDHNKD